MFWRWQKLEISPRRWGNLVRAGEVDHNWADAHTGHRMVDRYNPSATLAVGALMEKDSC